MKREYAVALIGLGCLGLLQFGLVLVMAKSAGTEIRDLLEAILTTSRRRRLDWWVRVAPLGLAVSAALVVVALVALVAGFTAPS